MHIKTRIHTLLWWLRDNVLFRYRILISFILSVLIFGAFKFTKKSTYYSWIMKLDRLGENIITRYLINREAGEFIHYSLQHLSHSPLNLENYIQRVLVLKDPVKNDKDEVLEKGVFLIKFTTTFPLVFFDLDIERLQKYFHIVLEPSWAGYCLPEIFIWMSTPHPVIVQASDGADQRLLSLLNRNLIPVSFGSSDWVDPSIFFKIQNTEKVYDAISVSNFNMIKRPYRLVKALKKLQDRGHYLKVALVCATWGESKDEILDYIASSGLTGVIDIYEDMSQVELNTLLNKSKVNILLSLKEGSNRSLFEGFFADVPGIVLQENVGVNKDYFNRYTGKCIPEKELECALLDFSNNWRTYSPRLWALENIAPPKTTKKLEAAIASLEGKNSLILPVSEKVNIPEATLVDKKNTPYWDTGKIVDEFKRTRPYSVRQASNNSYT